MKRVGFLDDWQKEQAKLGRIQDLVRGAREGGGLPSKRLLGMYRWMGSHFYNWTDYNGVTFLVELLEWGRKFSGFLG